MRARHDISKIVPLKRKHFSRPIFIRRDIFFFNIFVDVIYYFYRFIHLSVVIYRLINMENFGISNNFVETIRGHNFVVQESLRFRAAVAGDSRPTNISLGNAV